MENSKTPVSFEDLWRFKFVGDPDISTDGNKIAWVQTNINADKNAYESSIWMSRPFKDTICLAFYPPRHPNT